MPRSKSTITYKKKDSIAIVSMNRPEFNNAQNGKMTYDLDKAFKKAVDDDDIKVIVLNGNGKHFSAGHDIGCLLYTSPSPRDQRGSRMPSSG